MTDIELGKGKSCFIIGPIGDRLEPLGTPGKIAYENALQMWDSVFEPACAVFGLTPVRADKISESGEIPEQIFTYLRDADIVIADVSGGNANVMYELGLRHSRDLVTIQIGEHERLPFDVNTIRTIKFKRNEAGRIEARNALIEALRTALQGGGSPVTATRVWTELERTLTVEDVAAAAALSRTSDDPADEAPGSLDVLAAGEEALETASEILGNFAEYMGQLGAITQEFTPKVTEAGSFKQRLSEVRRFADELGPPASEMDETSDQFLGAVEEIDAMVGVLIEQLTADPSQFEAEGVGEFIAMLLGLGVVAGQAGIQFTSAIAPTREMRSGTKLLSGPAKSIEHSLNTMLRGIEIVISWGDRLRDLPGFVEPEEIPTFDSPDEGDDVKP